MAHYDKVMPGRIHFLPYARLVEDTESEIRRLLDFCGLPFEEGCLRFWESRRAVATPSAEQVRRPIFREALEQWRKFEPWLGPLKEALAEAEALAAAAAEPAGLRRGADARRHEHARGGDREAASVTTRAPAHPAAWRKLAELLRLAGEDKQGRRGADAAAEQMGERGEPLAAGPRSAHARPTGSRRTRLA